MAASDHHTLATFKASRLGLNLTGLTDSEIEDALDEAKQRIDPDDWGDLTEQGHGYLTRILLDSEPYGTEGRLESNDGETPYERHFRELQGLVGTAVAPRTTGD